MLRSTERLETPFLRVLESFLLLPPPPPPVLPLGPFHAVFLTCCHFFVSAPCPTPQACGAASSTSRYKKTVNIIIVIVVVVTIDILVITVTLWEPIPNRVLLVGRGGPLFLMQNWHRYAWLDTGVCAAFLSIVLTWTLLTRDQHFVVNGGFELITPGVNEIER